MSNQLGDGLYVVERILRKRIQIKEGVRTVTYLVKWEGYDDQADRTWEPQEHLQFCQQLVDRFQRKVAEKKEKERLENEERMKNTPITQEQSHEKRETIKPKSSAFQPVKGTEAQPIQIQDKPRKMLKKDVQTPKQSSNKTVQKPQFQQKKSQHQGPQLKQKKSDQTKKNHKEPKQAKSASSDQAVRSYQILKSYLPPQKQKNVEEKEKKEAKPQGRVVNHCYREGKLWFEFQKMRQKKIQGVIEIPSSRAQREFVNQAYRYMQELIIKLQKDALKR